MEKPFIMVKASGMPMINELEQSIKEAGYKIFSIYNISNGWETIKQFYLTNQKDQEFNLEVEIHAWLEKYLFGESAYIIFVDTDEDKSLEEKCKDVLAIKKSFRNKFTLSRDGTFMVALDVSRTQFKPLIKWHKGQLKVGKNIFDSDMSQTGIFRGYYFKYAHTPDNEEDLKRHLKILIEAKVICEDKRIYPTEWKIIKSAIIGNHIDLLKIIKEAKQSDNDQGLSY